MFTCVQLLVEELAGLKKKRCSVIFKLQSRVINEFSSLHTVYFSRDTPIMVPIGVKLYSKMTFLVLWNLYHWNYLKEVICKCSLYPEGGWGSKLPAESYRKAGLTAVENYRRAGQWALCIRELQVEVGQVAPWGKWQWATSFL